MAQFGTGSRTGTRGIGRLTGRRGVGAGIALTALAALAVHLAPAHALPPPATGCADDEMLLVRGAGDTTTGPAGAGGTVVPGVAEKVTGDSVLTITTTALDYPAGESPTTSVPAGAKAVQARIAEVSAACPGLQFALIGHEMGAAVVSAAITGVPEAGVAPIDPALVKFIDSVILFQDPGRVPGETFNVGTAAEGATGAYPRTVGAFGGLAKKTQSYCDAGDPICSGGTTPVPGSAYTAGYTDAAAAFIINEIED